MSFSCSSLDHGEKPRTGWEFLLAFPAPDINEIKAESFSSRVQEEPKQEGREEVLVKLREARFSYSQIWIPAARMILAQVALPENVLHDIAEIQKYPLQLTRDYGSGYLEYKKDRRQCYVNDSKPHFFTCSERLDILLSTMESASKWGAGINIDKLKQDRALLDAYPLHNRKLRSNLSKDVITKRWWDPNFKMSLRRIKEYFGTRIALYFGFFQYYNTTLKALFLISIPFLLLLGEYNSKLIFVMKYLYGFVIVGWSTLFLKFWKRRNYVLNFEWGCLTFSTDSSFEVRPQFNGIPRKGFYSKGGFVGLEDLDESSFETSSPDLRQSHAFLQNVGFDCEMEPEAKYTGTKIQKLPIYLYANDDEKIRKIRENGAITFVFSAVVISFTFLPIMFQNQLVSFFSDYTWSKAVPGVLTGTLIFLSEQIWSHVYPTLSDSENHRRNQSYFNSLKIKKFAFEFAANFTPLAYVAFVKPLFSTSDCSRGNDDRKEDCYNELKWLLASVIVAKSTIDGILGIALPSLLIFKNRVFLFINWVRYSSSVEPKSLLDFAEEIQSNTEVKESSLNTFENMVDEYCRLIIQFAYISLFGVACPLIPTIILLANLISQRIEGLKFLYLINRVPERTNTNIGIWQNILHSIIILSTWTNSWTTCITNNWENTGKSSFILFFVTQNILILGVLLINFLCQDIPREVHRRKSKQDYIIARRFHHEEKPYYSHSLALDKREEMPKIRERNEDLKELVRKNSFDSEAGQNNVLELNTTLRNRLFDALSWNLWR